MDNTTTTANTTVIDTTTTRRSWDWHETNTWGSYANYVDVLVRGQDYSGKHIEVATQYCTSKQGDGLFQWDDDRQNYVQLRGLSDFTVRGLSSEQVRRRMRYAIAERGDDDA